MLSDEGVRFRTRGEATATLAPEQFIHRFLQHVLPTGFVKIRHYGLMASGNATTKLEVARRLLEAERPEIPLAIAAFAAVLLATHPSAARAPRGLARAPEAPHWHQPESMSSLRRSAR